MRILSKLLPGECGVVKSVNTKSNLYRRFTDMGIIPGTKVYCALKSPLGDPVAYFVRGTLISLRSEDSANIVLE